MFDKKIKELAIEIDDMIADFKKNNNQDKKLGEKIKRGIDDFWKVYPKFVPKEYQRRDLIETSIRHRCSIGPGGRDRILELLSTNPNNYRFYLNEEKSTAEINPYHIILMADFLLPIKTRKERDRKLEELGFTKKDFEILRRGDNQQLLDELENQTSS